VPVRAQPALRRGFAVYRWMMDSPGAPVLFIHGRTYPACAMARSAWALMVFTIEASPLERVGERCLPSPIALMKDGSLSRMSRALCPE